MTYVLDSIGAGGGLELELDDVSDAHDAVYIILNNECDQVQLNTGKTMLP